MQKLHLPAAAVAIAAFTFLVGPGCTKKSKEARHLRKADSYYDAGKYESAELEYINVLQDGSDNPDAIGRLGVIYLEEGRPQKAFAYLSEATRLDPSNLEVRKKLAQLQMEIGKFKEAIAGLNFVLDHQPTDADAPLLLVNAARTRDDVEAARTRLLALPSPAPQKSPVLVALGTIDLHERKYDDAEAAFARATAVDPKSADLSTELGFLYLAKKDQAKAESAFADAAKQSGPYSPKKIQYAELEMSLGKIEDAKKTLENITSEAPLYLPAWVKLAQIASQKKSYDEGLADVGKALAVDSENPGALLEKSKLLLAKGSPKDAVTDMESASRDYPKSAQMEIELARAYMAAGSADKAEMSLKRALAIAPGAADAQMMLATVYVSKGDQASAIPVLRKLTLDHPKDIPARMLLGEAYRKHGETNEALSVFNQLSVENPKEIGPQMMIGTIYMQGRQPEMAQAAFEKVRLINPQYLPALERLIDLDLAGKNFGDAHKRINEQMAAHPSDGLLPLMLARIDLAQRDAAGAEAALKHSIKLQPDGTRAYSMLAGLYLSTNRQGDALADLKAAVVKNPKDIDALILIGTIQDRQNDYDGARATYENVLSINPDSVTALNNLAYLYSEHFKDYDKALTAAETAQRLLPDEPHIADTLGWVLYRQHKYSRAFPLLANSAERLPTEPDVQYHLGMTAYMLGREDSARDALQRSLDLSPQFGERDEASRRLAVLKLEPGKGGDAERELLEKAVSENKDDTVALNRLASLYENGGETDKAIATCEKALEISPDNPAVLAHMARLYLAKNDVAKAVEYGKKARQLAPDDAQLAHVLGVAAYQSGDYPWSLSLLQEAAQKLPDDPQLHYDLGRSYYSEGNVPDSEAQMKAALNAGTAFKQSGETVQFVQMLDFAADPRKAVQAKAAIGNYLEAHPDEPAALMASAAVHEEIGDKDAAKKEYAKVLARLPDFTPAKRSMAILFAASGEDDKTAFDFAVKARAAFPDDPAVAQALGIINYRRGDYFNAKNLLADALLERGDDPDLNFYFGMTEVNLKETSTAKKALQKALDEKLSQAHSTEARQALDKIK
jgi:tetratricopeptide (TPR) repeat protein